MRPSVRNAFVAFSAPLEGVVHSLYADVKGLVTVAIGNLVDPVEYALTLPFVRPDGTLASSVEIRAAWTAVKKDQRCAQLGWRYAAKLPANNIRLTDEGVQKVVSRKLGEVDAQLAARFPEWESWPADAQLATLSMAWACGAGFRFPLLIDALLAQDFERASRECKIRTEGNPGVRPRNEANRVLFLNAAISRRLDPDRLYWPTDLASSHVDRDAETQPDLALDHDTTLTELEIAYRNDPVTVRVTLDEDEPDSAA